MMMMMMIDLSTRQTGRLQVYKLFKSLWSSSRLENERSPTEQIES